MFEVPDNAVHVDARFDAAAGQLFSLVRDITRWPVYLGSMLYARVVAVDGRGDVVEHWHLVDEARVRKYTTSWRADPARTRITFESVPDDQVPAVHGCWIFEEAENFSTATVYLWHPRQDRLLDDRSGHDDTLRTAAGRLIDALRSAGLRNHSDPPEVLTTESTLSTEGMAADAYRFLRDFDQWPARIDHVREVRARPGSLIFPDDDVEVQIFDMVTTTADGRPHRTRSARLCFPTAVIAYKQLTPPALILGQAGSWSCAEDGVRTALSCRHTVLFETATLIDFTGADASRSRTVLEEMIDANSTRTLEHAGAWAEMHRNTDDDPRSRRSGGTHSTKGATL